MAAICYWSISKFLPIPSRNAFRNAARRAAAARLLWNSVSCTTSLQYKKLACNAPLASENSHFFKWLFTKMAVSIVSDPESEQELAESHLMLKNDCVCFRMSSSFIFNNPSLQIHSFSEDWGKCNQTGNPSISDFSTNLTSDILILADSSHLPSDEAYRQCLSLLCNRLSTPCYTSPTRDIFSTKFSLKRSSAGGECVHSVTWHL